MDESFLTLETKFELQVTQKEHAEDLNKKFREERNVLGQYNKEELLSENEKIARQLGNAEMWEGLAPLSVQREKEKLKNRSLRNRTILVLQEGKEENAQQRQSNGDLADVQDELYKLDQLLRLPFEEGEKTRMTKLINAYHGVSEKMDAFIEKYGHSRMPVAKERVKKLRALKRDLQNEMHEKLTANSAAIASEEQRPAWAKCPMDFLEGKHINAEINGTSAEYVLERQREVLGVRRAKNKSDSKEMRQVKLVFKNMTFSFMQTFPENDVQFDLQKNSMKQNYKILISKCDAYLRKHKKPSKTEERERVAAVQDLKERSIKESTRIIETAEIMYKKKNQHIQGLTWADAYAYTSRQLGIEKDATEKMDKLLVGPRNVPRMLTVITAMNNVAAANEDQNGFLTEKISKEWIKTNIGESEINVLLAQRAKLITEIKMNFNSLRNQPVPDQARKKGQDDQAHRDPLKEMELSDAYARLMVQRSAAFKLYKGITNLAYMLDAGEAQNETEFADKEYSAAEYFQKKKEQAKRDNDYSDIANAENIFSGKGFELMDESFVKQTMAAFEREELAESKDIVKNFVGAERIGFDRKELANARNAIK